MSLSALRPRSTTEIVDASFQLFRTHAGPLVMGSALAYAPLLVVQLLLLGDPRRFQAPGAVLTPEFGTFWLGSMVLSLLSYAFMTALLTVLVSQAYLGEPVDVAVAVRRTLPRLLTVVAANLAVWVLVGIGFLFLFFPGVYLALRYFAVTPAIVLEQRGTSGALARSSELSNGRKWHLFVTLLLMLAIYFVIFTGVALVASITGGFVVQAVASALLTICLYPLLATTLTLLYYDARIQSEGLDIEMMADALGQSPSPAV